MSPAAMMKSWLIAAKASAKAAEKTSVRPKAEKMRGLSATQSAKTSAKVTSGISAETIASRRRARSAATCACETPPVVAR